MSIRGYAIRGLAGGPPLYFSRGMDTLANRLRLVGADCSVHAQGWLLHPYGNVEAVFADALKAARSGARIVLAGHSMGADAALKVAVKLGAAKVSVPLVACFDPTSFSGALLGPPPVPANVGCALNFYQKVDPVGRGTLRPATGFKGRLIQERHDQPHVTLDDDPALHARVVNEVRSMMAAQAA
jgi:pimeloyl-ACP methyl ester carboxylesterase